MSRKPQSLYRRDFLKLLGGFTLTSLTVTVVACNTGRIPEGIVQATSTPDAHIEPNAALLMLMAGYTPVIEGAAGLNPEQLDILGTMLQSNAVSSGSGIPALQRQAVEAGIAVGCSICSDSRVVVPGVVAPEAIQDLPPLMQAANIGAQPMQYAGVNRSFFFTHVMDASCTTGCGALGGIEELVKGDKEGIEVLRHHGVSESTINELRRLVNMGANADPMQWAQEGARIQAEMNKALNGPNHYVAYGVMGHADGTLQMGGIIDGYGTPMEVSADPLLEKYSSVLFSPHPVLEALQKGQSPVLNVVNGSRMYSTEALMGDMMNNPGVVFRDDVDKVPGKPLTLAEAKKRVAGIDYSTGHLPQSGRVLTLFADNQEDMQVLSTALFTEGVQKGSFVEFIQGGGVVVEAIPNNVGQLSKVAIMNTERFKPFIERMNVFKAGVISDAAISEFLNIAKENRALGLFTEEQLTRMFVLYEKFAPILKILGFGLNVAGNAIMVNDIYTYVQEDMRLRGPVANEYFGPDNTITCNLAALPSDQFDSLKAAFGGANPYITSGMVEGVTISQERLATTFMGAAIEWMSHGPGSSDPYEPWSSIPSINEAGKLLALEIEMPTTGQGSEPAKKMIQLATTLVLRPGFDPTGKFLNYNVPSTKDNKPDYANQPMMLYDVLTGGYVDFTGLTKPIQFLAQDKDNPGAPYYIMQASPAQDLNGAAVFKLEFVGFLPQN